jgi:hypothetical protein
MTLNSELAFRHEWYCSATFHFKALSYSLISAKGSNSSADVVMNRIMNLMSSYMFLTRHTAAASSVPHLTRLKAMYNEMFLIATGTNWK